MQTKDSLTFEEAVVELEAIVETMENGSLSLDDCLREFQRAVELSRYCSEKLSAAEAQLGVLTEEHGLRRLESFPAGESAPQEPGDPFAE